MTNNPVWTYITHNEAMRIADEKFQTERDRRYAEVNVEREKALKIKETADRDAMELAREAQKYKEERNDIMREQNLGAAGMYAKHSDLAEVANKMETSINLVAERMEAALAPLANYVSSQKGGVKATDKTVAYVIAGIGFLFGLLQYLS